MNYPKPVRKIAAGSPAERAGFMTGDIVVSSQGISRDDIKAWSRQPRADIGEIRTYIVKRNNCIGLYILWLKSLSESPN
jgi:predicted metalloprotease with PDZ domain